MFRKSLLSFALFTLVLLAAPILTATAVDAAVTGDPQLFFWPSEEDPTEIEVEPNEEDPTEIEVEPNEEDPTEIEVEPN